MKESAPKKFSYYIGIDVSKHELDYAVMRGKEFLFHREGNNAPGDIASFIDELKDLPKFMIAKSVFCMEHTGIYCNHVLAELRKRKANVVMENALQIKSSLGIIRGKYDKIDAIRIAQYAYINREQLSVKEFKRPVLIQLANLFTLRNRLVGVRVSLKTSLSEQAGFVKKRIQQESAAFCTATIHALEHDLESVEDAIDHLIASDERLKHLNETITSVGSVGRILSIQILISTNEFRDIRDPKKFACYAGVAPFKKESGIMKGKAKVSHIANKRVKATLHVCALNAVQQRGELKAYYERKIAEGKPKMAVLNAVRYKLIVRVFACVQQDRAYEKDYAQSSQHRPAIMERDMIQAVT